MHLVKKAHVKAGLRSFIAGCPAAVREQLIWGALSSKVFLKGVDARIYCQFSEKGILGWEEAMWSARSTLHVCVLASIHVGMLPDRSFMSTCSDQSVQVHAYLNGRPSAMACALYPSTVAAN